MARILQFKRRQKEELSHVPIIVPVVSSVMIQKMYEARRTCRDIVISICRNSESLDSRMIWLCRDMLREQYSHRENYLEVLTDMIIDSNHVDWRLRPYTYAVLILEFEEEYDKL